MYVYQLDLPIDDFGLMIPFKKYYEKCCKLTDQKLCEQLDEYYPDPDSLRSKLRRSLRSLARKDTYWEGDIRGNDLYIGSLPDAEEGCSSNYYFALKQDNNGSSFIISEIPFLHLTEFLIEENINRPVIQKIQDGIKKIVDDFSPLQEEE